MITYRRTVAAWRTVLTLPLLWGSAQAASPQQRSIALLRDARRMVLEKKWDAAKAAYGKAAAVPDAPAHLRREAEQCAAEMDRRRAGLAPRAAVLKRLAPPRLPAPGATFHVAPAGSDTNPGTAALPFASLERARAAIRELRGRGSLPAGGVAVVVHGGEYRVARAFRLEATDSGTQEAPVVYKAAAGEKPRFRYGRRLTGFRSISDPKVLAQLPEPARSAVVHMDLRSAGVDRVVPLRLGGFASGAGFRTWPVAELFFNGAALTLARWPNEGFTRVAAVAKKGRIAYEGDRPSRWREEPDAWLYGYWFYDWADSYERIASIDPDQREILLSPPYHRYGYRKGQRFHALNLLSELDAPGEWYLDRTNLTLYLWPPSDPKRAVVELSLGDTPVVEMENVSHVALVGLIGELGGADGIVLKGGEGCLIAGCTLRCLGGNGMVVSGGRRHRILSCDIQSMGRGGVVLTGGDRRTLARGDHTIENCHIRDLSRIDHTYTPGVRLEGVGNRVRRNLIHGVASSALRVEGNDHLIEGNEVFDVLIESDDQGGADMFGNATYRGDVFRYNWWHHIGNWRGTGEQPHCGHAGIRLDDAICGVLVYGNVFQKCSAGKLGFGGVQIHGGKENIVDNNLFIDCAAAISFSPWGEQRWQRFIRGAFAKGRIDRDLYLARYPALNKLAEGHDVNHVWRNVVVRCEKFLLRDSVRHDLLENWVVPRGDARARAGLELLAGERSPASAAIGFRPIRMDEIGLYEDAYRTSLPVKLLEKARTR